MQGGSLSAERRCMRTRDLVAAVDCGTSVIKAAIVGADGGIVSMAQAACPCAYRSDGGIEQDADGIVRTAMACLRRAVRDSRGNGLIRAVSVSSQRATVICTDRRGDAIADALSWQDMRGTSEIEALRREIDDRSYYRITGVPNNPVFSLGKILWMKRRRPALYRRCEKFVLVGDYLLRKLGTDQFFTDESSASLTGMLDVSSRQWSGDILHAAGVTAGKLPALVQPGREIGRVSAEAAARSGLPRGTPIIAGGGDQQCAGIGSGCVEKGLVSYTLGTAGMVMAYSDTVVRDPAMQIACCVHAVPGAWDIEGLQNSAGSCLSWLAGLINSGRTFDAEFFKRVAAIAPGSAGVRFLPHLAGASAPRWNPRARGAFLGLAFGQSREALARSVMEGVTFQAREIMDVCRSLDIPVREFRLTGGGSAIETWNQMQADIHGMPVTTLRNEQASLLGAAILAACGAGLFTSVPEAARCMVATRRTYRPRQRARRAYEELFRRQAAIAEGLGQGEVLDS